jgi:hypothetical protein
MTLVSVVSQLVPLQHLRHVGQQQHKHQGVEQNAHLSGTTPSVLDVAADQGQLAHQIIGQGVGNQKEGDERNSLGHWYYILGKNLTDSNRWATVMWLEI